MTFEVRDWDAAGRLGELEVPRAGVTVETPALLPVVNPHVQAIEPARLGDEFGAEMLITNAYVLWGSDDLREDVERGGVHDVLGFDGAIMTDSGSFQLAEYGEIDVDTREILAFQRAIGSDVGTPVDVPTPPDVPRERAEDELATTQERLELAAEFDAGDMLVNAPIQGSTVPALREAAAEHAAETGLDVFPVGAVVPLMNAYRYEDVAEVVGAARRGLPLSAPVHLFGAGHPMMFALAVALGCDLFDSAAYALYADDDRYLTVGGTHHLGDLDYLPCECPVCATHGAEGLADLAGGERRDRLAEHNLQVSFGEMRRVKQAIRDGSLLELVETRARAHPTLLDGYRAALEDGGRLEATDPASKGTFFYGSGERAVRPEVARHHDRLGRLSTPDDLLVTEKDADLRGADHEATWRLVPPFGPVPPALFETYPLTAERPDRIDDRARASAVAGVRALVEAHPGTDVTVAHRGWADHLLATLPDVVDAVDLAG
jgi:7-cyano-7-deazaguanine tRNA-ribosyltransferase